MHFTSAIYLINVCTATGAMVDRYSPARVLIVHYPTTLSYSLKLHANYLMVKDFFICITFYLALL